MNRRSDIGSVPEDINTCKSQLQLPTVHEDPSGEGSTSLHQQATQKLSQKFFPLENSPPPSFVQYIFDLVANTYIWTFKMDDAIELLQKAQHVARDDSDHDHPSSPFRLFVSRSRALVPPVRQRLPKLGRMN